MNACTCVLSLQSLICALLDERFALEGITKIDKRVINRKNDTTLRFLFDQFNVPLMRPLWFRPDMDMQS